MLTVSNNTFVQRMNMVLFSLWNILINLIYNKTGVIKKVNEKRQENPVVWWVVVIVAVISILAIMAACKAFGGEYAGEFSVLGILKVKVKCKS